MMKNIAKSNKEAIGWRDGFGSARVTAIITAPNFGERIRRLRAEAAEAGDEILVSLCDEALNPAPGVSGRYQVRLRDCRGRTAGLSHGKET